MNTDAVTNPEGHLMNERVTNYQVSALPLDGSAGLWSGAFDIDVTWSGRGDLWAVRRMGRVFDADGIEEWEPQPSERDDKFLTRFRHDLPTALAIARKVAPMIVVNGTTALEAASRLKSQAS